MATIPTTPSARIARGYGIRFQAGCHVRTPEHDRHGITTDCPNTADRLVVHVDDATEHGPFCDRHARERVARCLAGTCERED